METAEAITEAAHGAIAAWFMASSAPRLLVTGELRLVVANEGAKALLRAGDCLTLRHNQVAPVTKEDTVRLLDALATACGRTNVVVRSLDGEARLVVRVERASNDDLFSLELRLVDEIVLADLVDLQKVFGLTRGEAAVARRLLSCEAPQAIALSMGLSVDTVRTHLKSIYAKCGARNQLGFVARVAQYVA